MEESGVRSQETGGERPLESVDVMALRDQELVLKLGIGRCLCGCGSYGLVLNGKAFQLSSDVAKALGTAMLGGEGASQEAEGQAPQATHKIGDKCELDGTEERISELLGGITTSGDNYMLIINGKAYVTTHNTTANVAKNIMADYINNLGGK